MLLFDKLSIAETPPDEAMFIIRVSKVSTSSNQFPDENDSSLENAPSMGTHLMKQSLVNTLSCKLPSEIVSQKPATSSEKEPLILGIAYHLVEIIPDFVTLTRLSQTCKLFKDLVDERKKISNLLFDQLEEGVPNTVEIPSCRARRHCLCNKIRKCLNITQPSHEVSAFVKFVRRSNRKKWAPCYGCRKLKTRDQFPYLVPCLDIHGCGSILRRCKLCKDENARVGKVVYYVGQTSRHRLYEEYEDYDSCCQKPRSLHAKQLLREEGILMMET